jgi:sugar-specific transcriptional regulator TrmB
MSKDWILKTLIDIGLRRLDAEVYVFLVTHGPIKRKKLATTLTLSNQQLYRSLKNLQIRGMITTTEKRPCQFSAVPFEKVLDLLSMKKEGQAKALEKVRQDLLESWHKIIENNSINVFSEFNQKNKTEKENDD